MALDFVGVTETIGTTEWSMVEDEAYSASTAQTEDCFVDVVVDVSALGKDDHFQLNIYEKVNGGTQQPLVTKDFVHGQSQGYAVLGLLLGEAWDVTLKKVSGTDRSCRVSTRKHTPANPTLSGASATIGSTRHSLPNNSTTLTPQTTDRKLQVFIDAANVTHGDEFLLIVWDSANAGSQMRLYEMPIRGERAFLMWTPLITVGESWDVTLEKLSGTDRSIGWSIRTDDGATTAGSSFPQLSNATTAPALRDYIIALVTALTPDVLSGDRFIAFRNEGNGDFVVAMEAAPAGALRRVQVRYSGDDDPPIVTNTDHERQLVTFQIMVAYPHTGRYGADMALDRDDVMRSDQHQLEETVGLYGQANFVSPNPNACWRDAPVSRLAGTSVDFLVVDLTLEFVEMRR